LIVELQTCRAVVAASLHDKSTSGSGAQVNANLGKAVLEKALVFEGSMGGILFNIGNPSTALALYQGLDMPMLLLSISVVFVQRLPCI